MVTSLLQIQVAFRDIQTVAYARSWNTKCSYIKKISHAIHLFQFMQIKIENVATTFICVGCTFAFQSHDFFMSWLFKTWTQLMKVGRKMEFCSFKLALVSYVSLPPSRFQVNRFVWMWIVIVQYWSILFFSVYWQTWWVAVENWI